MGERECVPAYEIQTGSPSLPLFLASLPRFIAGAGGGRASVRELNLGRPPPISVSLKKRKGISLEWNGKRTLFYKFDPPTHVSEYDLFCSLCCNFVFAQKVTHVHIKFPQTIPIFGPPLLQIQEAARLSVLGVEEEQSSGAKLLIESGAKTEQRCN